MQRHIRYQLSRFLMPILGCLLLGYFIYHLIKGDHGWLAWQRVQAELAASQAELAQVKEEKEKLEHRVQLLQSGSLDRDLLDERVRVMLDQVEGDDIILIEENQ